MAKTRGIISTILILFGLLSITTGAILYFLDYGMWLGLTRKLINDVHVISAVVMSLTMMVHFVLNRRIYMMEIKALVRNNSRSSD